VAIATTAFAIWLGGIGTGLLTCTECLSSGWRVAAWLGSAAGIGRIAADRFLKASPAATTLAVGVAIQLAMDQWLGSTGLLHGPWGWIALLPGWSSLIHAAVSRHHPARDASAQDAGSTWWWPAMPALTALIIAACVAPGILWSSEFGGYDVLEYHLQAPKEWLVLGSIQPLKHLAYSGMPNFVEGAFLHLMSLGGDPRDSAVACQLLHASMVIVAAAALGDAAECLAQRLSLDAATSRVTAWCATLATPWIIVTGSLAYSESGVLLALAALVSVSTRLSIGDPRAAGVAGILMAVVVGSKASSAILVLPGLILWMMAMPRGSWISWRGATSCGAAFLACGAPWLWRNWTATGAPLFPLLGSAADNGWWSAEQAARWNHAHASAAAVTDRLPALWNQLLAFGLGSNPSPGEPWRWFWGPLPWLAIAATLSLAFSPATRRVAAALALFGAWIALSWMSFTHLQSRFLIPLAIPGALAVALAAGWWRRAYPRALGPLCVTLAVWACLPLWFLATDTPGAVRFIGQERFFRGDADWLQLRTGDARARDEVRANISAELLINHLQPSWRWLGVGWSTPFWTRPDAALDWASVWDTNPLEATRGLADDQAIAALSEKYDAIIVDVPMLLRWKRSGWLSPNIDLEQVRRLSATLPHLAELSGGRLVLGLRGHTRLEEPHSDAEGVHVDPSSRDFD
jgi:hypothetical protein